MPRIALPIFPGSNGEVDNMQTLRRCGFDAFFFRWNEDISALKDCDGYFFGAGFSYEDRGRSGMVAARDPFFDVLRKEAEAGKVLIGNCNGAQMLIESGLVPLGDGVRMALAHNAINRGSGPEPTGFLNQWIWMTPLCKRDRCATSDWSGVMHVPIAHGEGRFITRDPELIQELQKNDQLAFGYCDERGVVSEDPTITPNGSLLGIAGICNREGNVVALMPHPERTPLGDAYFMSIHGWLRRKIRVSSARNSSLKHSEKRDVPWHTERGDEVFIETIITNNEERTVEQALSRVQPSVTLKQYRYLSLPEGNSERALQTLSLFNPHKERAYLRREKKTYRWHGEKKSFIEMKEDLLKGVTYVRFDDVDFLQESLGRESKAGVCYDCFHCSEETSQQPAFLEVLSNPHSSTLVRLA